MRHKKSGRKLNRNSSHRKALMKNLAIAFIERELVKTTVPKAKELRCFIEPLITTAKEDSVANIVKLSGVTSFANFDSNDFAFVA